MLSRAHQDVKDQGRRQQPKTNRTPMFQEDRLGGSMSLTDKTEDELLRRKGNSNYKKPKWTLKRRN